MEQNLIVGVKINQKLQEQLDKCLPAHQIYFDKNFEYLQIHTINGEKVIGKILEQGANLDTISDYARNVKSILKKVCPGYPIPDSEIRVFVQVLIG